jgi:hypothetical protein
MKKSIRKLQKHKHKKDSKKHKKTMKQKYSHHKTRRYSKKYKGGNGDDNESPTKKARHNPPNEEEENTAIQKEQNKRMITFMLKAKKIEDKGPIIVPLSAPETVYEFMKKTLNLWNYAIQNFEKNPEYLTISRQTIDTLYNKRVKAVTQEHVGDEEEESRIVNNKSNAILEELFHYAANISDHTLNDEVKIPRISYFNTRSRDNPHIVYPPPPPENNDAEEE